MTRLTDKKIRWLVVQVVKYGKQASQVACVYGITPRRVRQLVQRYRQTGKMPMLKESRRPKTILTSEQKEAIHQAFREVKVSSRLLYFELKHRGHKIPKHKLVAYFKEKGWAIPNLKKQKKRKRCRYEWEYSGDLLHGDTHRTSAEHPYCQFFSDDASRKIMAGRESEKPATNQDSIAVMREAVKNAWGYNVVIIAVNTDRGSEFFSNQKEKNSESKSEFEKYLMSEGIKHIPSKPNNPQTNGKLERHWLEYDRHRWKFKTLQEYIDWYNNRIHGALDLDSAETPEQAFIRKRRLESMVGSLFK